MIFANYLEVFISISYNIFIARNQSVKIIFNLSLPNLFTPPFLPVTHDAISAVWLSGNIVGCINEVTLCRAGLVLRWVTVRGYTVGSLSLAIPPRVGVGLMSTGDGYGHRYIGKKRRVLHSSRPCYQDCWHTDSVG